MNTYNFTTNSPEETIALAEKVGAVLYGGEIIAYRGDLGAGKTTFTRGIAVGLGLDVDVSSPTFTIVNEYIGKKISLYHFDMYRIGSADEVEFLGFYDYMNNDSVLAVEWSENIEAVLPKNTIYITLEYNGDESRKITIIGDERFADIRN